MDIYCTICGEPWDMDELHEVENKTYEQAREEFWSIGCEVFGSTHNPTPLTQHAEMSAMLHDILGDDTDAIAAEMEDAEYFGYLD